MKIIKFCSIILIFYFVTSCTVNTNTVKEIYRVEKTYNEKDELLSTDTISIERFSKSGDLINKVNYSKGINNMKVLIVDIYNDDQTPPEAIFKLSKDVIIHSIVYHDSFGSITKSVTSSNQSEKLFLLYDNVMKDSLVIESTVKERIDSNEFKNLYYIDNKYSNDGLLINSTKYIYNIYDKKKIEEKTHFYNSDKLIYKMQLKINDTGDSYVYNTIYNERKIIEQTSYFGDSLLQKSNYRYANGLVSKEEVKNYTKKTNSVIKYFYEYW